MLGSSQTFHPNGSDAGAVRAPRGRDARSLRLRMGRSPILPNRVKPYSVIEIVAPGGITRGGRTYGPALVQIPGRLLEASQSELAQELNRRFGHYR
jgi:hypothetical protein